MFRQREKSKQTDGSPVALFNFFIERVRNQLHIVLAMSPIGDAFRTRLRKFPSLVNCCTIDWFQVSMNIVGMQAIIMVWVLFELALECTSGVNILRITSQTLFLPEYMKPKHVEILNFFTCFLQSWPADALQVVAQRFLAETEMSSSVRGGCVKMCQEFHTGTRQLSARFLNELKRHNYVTPTSYLELINTFKVLLLKKQG